MIKNLALAALLSTAAMTATAQVDDLSFSISLTQEEANAYITEFEGFMMEMTEALESVNDSTSAEAAANVLMGLKLRAAEMQRKMDAISASSPEVQQAVLPRVLGIIVQCGERVALATENIVANDYYGCDALRDLVEQLNTH